KHFNRHSSIAYKRRNALNDALVLFVLLLPAQRTARGHQLADLWILGNQRRIGRLTINEPEHILNSARLRRIASIEENLGFCSLCRHVLAPPRDADLAVATASYTVLNGESQVCSLIFQSAHQR